MHNEDVDDGSLGGERGDVDDSGDSDVDDDASGEDDSDKDDSLDDDSFGGDSDDDDDARRCGLGVEVGCGSWV